VAAIATVFLSAAKQHSGPDALAISAVAVAALVLSGCALVFLLPRHAREAGQI
jgi:hypothetical protein